jgi:hypothetical protein
MALARYAVMPVAVVLATLVVSADQAKPPLTAETLFDGKKVWTIDLTFTREMWDALTPAPSRSFPSPRTDGFKGPEGKRNGISALRGLDFEYVHAAFAIDGRRFADVGVRYKGNGTYTSGQSLNKISFKVDLNKYVKGQALAGVTTLNLHNNITDASWMNEALAYRLYRDFDVPAPRTSYARVYITVTGAKARRYAGLYSIVENVDDRFGATHFGVKGGAILKPVTQRLFDDLGRDWTRYNQAYDPKTTLSAADKARVFELCDLVTHASDSAYAAKLPAIVDLDAFARYAAVLVWLANPDSPLQQGQNYYVYLHPSTRQLAFIPWDQDHSFGQFAWGSERQQQNLDILRPWTSSNRFLERTFAVPAFHQRYLAALERLTRTLTQPERLSAQVDELAAVLGPIAVDEPLTGRYDLFRKAVAGQSFDRPFYGGTVTPIKPFARIRQASVLKQLQQAQGR